MIINPYDRSNYFKGLLILVGKDKNITPNESLLIKKIGNILGFSHDFINQAINNFFENNYIIEEPPVFSNYHFAELFIKDGIKIAFVNKVLNLDQVEWLSATALKNNLSKQWFYIELENLLESYNSNDNANFEIQKYFDRLNNNNSYIY